METIKIIISADCKITYEVSGVRGPKCRELTAPIDAICGNKVLEDHKTAEYNAAPANKTVSNRGS